MSKELNAISLAIHLREGLRLLLAKPIQSLVTTLTFALTLCFGAEAIWTMRHMETLRDSLDEDLELMVALEEGLDETQTKAVLLEIAGLQSPSGDFVDTVRWVGPQEQRAKIAGVLGDELLEGLDGAIFPDSGLVAVRLNRQTLSSPEGYASFEAGLQKIQSVQGVGYLPFDPREVHVLHQLQNQTVSSNFILGLVALGVSLLAGYAFFRGALQQSAQAMALQRAFGASTFFLHGRFYAAALLLGAIGALWALLYSLSLQSPHAELMALMVGRGQTSESFGLFGVTFLLWSILGGFGLAFGSCEIALRQPQSETHS